MSETLRGRVLNIFGILSGKTDEPSLTMTWGYGIIPHAWQLSGADFYSSVRNATKKVLSWKFTAVWGAFEIPTLRWGRWRAGLIAGTPESQSRGTVVLSRYTAYCLPPSLPGWVCHQCCGPVLSTKLKSHGDLDKLKNPIFVISMPPPLSSLPLSLLSSLPPSLLSLSFSLHGDGFQQGPYGEVSFLVYPKYWKMLKLTSLSMKLFDDLNIGILFTIINSLLYLVKAVVLNLWVVIKRSLSQGLHIRFLHYDS